VRARVTSTEIVCDVYWAPVKVPTARHVRILDRFEMARREAYRHREDADRFTLGAALVRAIAAAHIGVAPEGIIVDRTCPRCGRPHGKPRVSGLELSVTHSGGYLGVAVGERAPVGLDVEEVRAFDHDLVLTDVCAPEERHKAIGPEEFYGYWTRKEALLKAVGVGLGLPMSGFYITAPTEPPLVLRAPPGFPNATMVDVAPAAGYRGALAVLTTSSVAVRTLDALEALTAV
jgi:4'-phosphopantetheinyl transferase